VQPFGWAVRGGKKKTVRTCKISSSGVEKRKETLASTAKRALQKENDRKICKYLEYKRRGKVDGERGWEKNNFVVQQKGRKIEEAFRGENAGQETTRRKDER